MAGGCIGYLPPRLNSQTSGKEVTSIRSNDGAAALAKNASDAADHMDVASVVKPVGLRINVAGNSFIVSRNTMAAPARMPVRNNGSVTLVSTRTGDLCRLRATSSMLGLT